MIELRKGGPDVAAAYLAERLNGHLDAGRKVLWLLSGGSSVSVAVAAQAQLHASTETGLTVMQIDERYGLVGHPNSNWKAIEEAGLDTHHGRFIPVLSGKPIEQTAADYAEALARELERADVVVGLLGIGADGHTAGILPASRAVNSQKLLENYEGPDFKRLTVTAEVIKRLDEAVVFAAGPEKCRQIDRLRSSDLSPTEQPAQLLKLVKRLTIFTDCGE